MKTFIFIKRILMGKRQYDEKKYASYLMLLIASLFVVSASGCGNGCSVKPDRTPPTISFVAPANLDTDVLLGRKIVATFSEEMDPLTITATSFTLQIGADPVKGTLSDTAAIERATTAPVTGSLAYTGTTATFTPDVDFAATTVYTATITIEVKDLSGNAMEKTYVWSFTTGAVPDTTAPIVISTDPANGGTGVPINNKIAATFSEVMDPLTITTASFTLSQGGTPVSGSVIYSGLTATFTPSSYLDVNTGYTATITTVAEDLAGNALANTNVWSFTTGAALDTTRPTVTSTDPVNGATDVPVNKKIAATFSEVMDPLSITTATFILMKGTTPVTGTVLLVGSIATFSLDIELESDTDYTATITTGAKDLAGNALASAYVWSFKTGSTGDTTTPTVTSTNPADNATKVAINKKITATFSESMLPASITTAGNFILTGPGATSVTGTVEYDLTTKIATFTPGDDLASSTKFTATVTTWAEDLAGNPLAIDYVWTFTTVAALPVNPTAPVLGEAGRFVILASQKVTTTGVTAVSNGDIGIEDQARSYYEGFTAGGSPGQFTELTNGLSYAHDDIDPALIPPPYASTIAFINQVRTDLGIAYTYLAADPNPGAPTQVCPIELGGQNLTRGVYKTAADVTLQTGDLTLDAQGDPNSVWIFSIDGTLTTGAPNGNIILANGALARNVYWRTAGVTAIGAGTSFYGNVFAWTQVNMLSGADITGRLFAVTSQVTLISNTVTKAP